MSAKDDMRTSLYAEYAPAIGWMSMQWAYLEAVIDGHLLRTLIPLEPSDVCNIVTSNIEEQAKIQVALNVGHLRRPSDVWYDELRTVLNHVDNNLRPKRNRFIHDPLVTQLKSPYTTARAHTKARLNKSQSYQPPELSTYRETAISPDEIWNLADEIKAATEKIGLLAGQLRKATTQRPASPQRSP